MWEIKDPPRHLDSQPLEEDVTNDGIGPAFVREPVIATNRRIGPQIFAKLSTGTRTNPRLSVAGQRIHRRRQLSRTFTRSCDGALPFSGDWLRRSEDDL